MCSWKPLICTHSWSSIWSKAGILGVLCQPSSPFTSSAVVSSLSQEGARDWPCCWAISLLAMSFCERPSTDFLLPVRSWWIKLFFPLLDSVYDRNMNQLKDAEQNPVYWVNVSGPETSYLEQNYLILDQIHLIKAITWLILRFCPCTIWNAYKYDTVQRARNNFWADQSLPVRLWGKLRIIINKEHAEDPGSRNDNKTIFLY